MDAVSNVALASMRIPVPKMGLMVGIPKSTMLRDIHNGRITVVLSTFAFPDTAYARALSKALANSMA
jgi:hypothetical protein